MSRISVIIPVYNGAATIVEAIDSVLAQTLPDFELITVDDGSTDTTPELLARYGEAIRIITRPNGGISAARNTGLRAASGEYVALLDCDDVWLPSMLELSVAALDADPPAVLAYSDVALMDSNGRPLATSLIGTPMVHAPSFDDLFEQLWPIMPSAVVMRRHVLEAVGGFCEEFRGLGFEDAYCWMRARELGAFCYLPERLVKWRFAPFPRPLKKFGLHPRAAAIFARLVDERWGRPVEPLLASRRRASRSILGYIGLTELRDGHRGRAREAFRLALQLDRWRYKNYLRLLRTYLPGVLARSLTGRTARDRDHETSIA